MRSLTLVACSKQKASKRLPARELYTSPLFRLARGVAEASGAPWYILSAKHGLLDPEEVVAPYDLTLATMPAAERGRWVCRVLHDLFVLLDPTHGLSANGARVVFLAGSAYWQPLAFRLEDNGAAVETPLSGMGIGQQLRWMKGRLAEIQGEVA